MFAFVDLQLRPMRIILAVSSHATVSAVVDISTSPDAYNTGSLVSHSTSVSRDEG